MSQYTNLTSNTSSDWHKVPTGQGTLTIIGTWGGGTATVEVKNPQGDPAPIEEFTANVTKVIDFPHGVEVRVTLAGAAGPDLDVNIWG